MDEPSVGGTPRRGLAGATFGFFLGLGVVVVYGPAAEEFTRAMELSGVLLGLLVAAPNLIGSVLRIPVGAWADEIGPKRPFVVLLALSTLGMAGLAGLLVGFHPDGLGRRSYPLVFLFGALAGCGVGVFPIGSAQASYWYPIEKQGTALAVYGGLGNSAPGVFTVLVPISLAAVGLTTTYLLWLGVLTAGTFLYALLAVDPYYYQLLKRGVAPEHARVRAEELGQDLFPGGDTFDSIREAARLPRSWALVALYFISFGGFLALTVWLPTYWTGLHGVEPRTAGIVTAVGFVFLATGVRILGGVLSDRLGGERTSVLGFGTVALGALVMTGTQELAVAAVGMVVLAAGIGLGNAAVFQLVPHYVPEAVGGAAGLVGGVGAFGGFVVPPVLGLFVDVQGLAGYANGFVVYVVLGLTGVAIALSLKSLVDRG
ncbi:MFS transporter, NNP family, nitrate/nitrite transporter [Halalkaliarchaeum desulfuricum]|uniref:MFS transporter, NNP family, nitrate/nitrite transporter n=1 Tax=Halalkaliarchaeum desulfuricum TaxID=2055893 RepID=A0A343TLP5_9EURY|nr:MFS transporter [Halalkaliarchaeum desulfuricum]AUX10017.1 MFS transporter, NNP family, nitrate/nitrite transporter [Halalkaliarchaeum desulfuricum]